MSPPLDGLDAAGIIALLELKSHPEGGHYRETFRDPQGPEGRGFSTAIYYLLDAGETSHWHRVDAAEIWHHYAGAPLALSLSQDGRYVAFVSEAANLAPGDLNLFSSDAFLWDRSSGVITRVTAGNSLTESVSVSNDGRFVAFSSFSSMRKRGAIWPGLGRTTER